MYRHFYSIYGPFIMDFLLLKRSLGYKYSAGEYELGKFDRIASQREESTIGITKELASAVCEKQPNESDKSRVNRMQVLRQFAIFLNDMGHPSHIVDLPSFRQTFMPYIFTNEEISGLFDTCDSLRANNRNPRTGMFFIPVLVRLLYATGIRIGEALDLSIHDVDIKAAHLKVRDSKNGRERLMPFSTSMSLVLQDYLRFRERRAIRNEVDHLFVNSEGPISKGLPYKWFRKILFRSGIPHAGRGVGPRLHDLRHTFAVHSLVAMSEKGIDLYYSLPILSTYLGHRSLSATDKYVRLTAEMYPSLIEGVNKACPNIFPDINPIRT